MSDPSYENKYFVNMGLLFGSVFTYFLSVHVPPIAFYAAWVMCFVFAVYDALKDV